MAKKLAAIEAVVGAGGSRLEAVYEAQQKDGHTPKKSSYDLAADDWKGKPAPAPTSAFAALKALAVASKSPQTALKKP